MKRLAAFVIFLSLLFCFASCNAPENEKSALSSDFEQAESTLILETDKNRIVWGDENKKYVYYHNGIDVTGYEVYIKYDTVEDAKISQGLVRDMNDPTVKAVERNGKYVITKYNQSGYKYRTYAELQAASKQLGGGQDAE